MCVLGRKSQSKCVNVTFKTLCPCLGHNHLASSVSIKADDNDDTITQYLHNLFYINLFILLFIYSHNLSCVETEIEANYCAYVIFFSCLFYTVRKL